ncbi:hypothetical protein [Achromobacter phage Motura]|uniref:KTSC and Metallopeptidase-like N-terminal fusion domain-containing protein n=1 Tax=Achromobacter phage Motura TaxID=2591403 RepID=A0A514CT43_9CAUD|nr:hypothetical protein H1O15_gp146 [Achromobacter phage Motura]QDH83642.1 hypothetical protein [Achromobacter phage Motura]
MYSFCVQSVQRLHAQVQVQARIKDEDEYDWFRYTGPATELDFRGKPEALSKGAVFGVRPSSNGKHIRLVFKDKPTRVFTLPMDQAQRIAKHVKAA